MPACHGKNTRCDVRWFSVLPKRSWTLKEEYKPISGAWPAQLSLHLSSAYISTDRLPKMFELVVGYPPFDNLMPNKDDLIREWVSMLGNLPQKWARHFPCSEPDDVELDQVTLPDWLHDTYFDEGKKRDFAEAHIEELGELLQSMMQYCPSNRPGVSELLKSPWFQKNPWHEQQVAEHDKI
ncbi:MAG: hypothetical protein Q9185_005432 [Variospora sp. 1 TL-2023]